MVNTSALKSIAFWASVIVAILGILVSNGVVVEGTTAAEIVGWVIALLGGAGAGAQVAKPQLTTNA